MNQSSCFPDSRGPIPAVPEKESPKEPEPPLSRNFLTLQRVVRPHHRTLSIVPLIINGSKRGGSIHTEDQRTAASKTVDGCKMTQFLALQPHCSSRNDTSGNMTTTRSSHEADKIIASQSDDKVGWRPKSEMLMNWLPRLFQPSTSGTQPTSATTSLITSQS